MSKLTWDQVGERLYETGVEQGAIYPMTTSGTYGTGTVLLPLQRVLPVQSQQLFMQMTKSTLSLHLLRSSEERLKLTHIQRDSQLATERLM